jgi:hypothetical protein
MEDNQRTMEGLNMNGLEKGIIITGLNVLGGMIMYGLGRVTESKKNLEAWKKFKNDMEDLIGDIKDKEVEKES